MPGRSAPGAGQARLQPIGRASPKRGKNAELATSREELQSLNAELTALNRELRETVEQQRARYSDLHNILISTDVATLFLDAELNIRFFTPAAKSLFKLIASDVGRPLDNPQ